MSNIIDIPSEVIQINEAAKKVIDFAGEKMCERLDAKAEVARQVYLQTRTMKDLASWILLANRADSARITYNGWKRGEL